MKKLLYFFEIPASDFDRAVKFYEALFNVKLSTIDCGNEKMAFFPKENEQFTGALSWAEDFKPSKDGVIISLNVQDIDKTLSLVEQIGGKIRRTKTKIEADGVGYFALLSDSEDNTIGLHADN